MKMTVDGQELKKKSLGSLGHSAIFPVYIGNWEQRNISLLLENPTPVDHYGLMQQLAWGE